MFRGLGTRMEGQNRMILSWMRCRNFFWPPSPRSSVMRIILIIIKPITEPSNGKESLLIVPQATLMCLLPISL